MVNYMAVRRSKKPAKRPTTAPRRVRRPGSDASRKRRKSGSRLGRWLRAWRGFRGIPRTLRWAFACVLLLALAVATNFAVQVVRKPSELFFPVSDALNRTPAQTWRSYGPLFERHSTSRITPSLLAALAQVEASGNPVARTYWRWSWSLNPFDIYRPASSAVGMYQLIDGTFDQARRLCIRNHAVAEDGPWNDWRSCWFNGLYTRTVPGHAIEMTSAYLDRQVGTILARSRIPKASPQQVQRLAAVIHLCGAGAGARYAQRGFQLTKDQRCGAHPVRAYIARIESMKETFRRLA
jgi:hypothetical protein